MDDSVSDKIKPGSGWFHLMHWTLLNRQQRKKSVGSRIHDFVWFKGSWTVKRSKFTDKMNRVKNRSFFNTGQMAHGLRIPSFLWGLNLKWDFSKYENWMPMNFGRDFFLRFFKISSFYRKTTELYPSRVPMSRSKSNHSAFRGAKLTCNIPSASAAAAARLKGSSNLHTAFRASNRSKVYKKYIFNIQWRSAVLGG